jgi:glycine/D-amino acid oxidase-like deaminating enzyme
MRVVVVGAGVLGAALAWTLARRGEEVTLVEQHEPADPRAASHAVTRILRFAHGDDVEQTRSAWQARRLWRELEAESGRRLFEEVGIAWLYGTGEETGREVLLAEGIDVELLSPDEAGRLLPGLSADGLDHVLFEPQAGLLRATDAVRALLDGADAAGAELLRGRVTPDADGARLGGKRLEADVTVWACGAWTPRLFPGLVRGSVIQQDVCYLAAGPEWASPPAPAWNEPSRSASGSGDLGGFGFKVGLDVPGPALDPDESPRPPVPQHEAEARAYLAGRFPGLATAPVLRTETCQTVVLEPEPAVPAVQLAGEVRLVQHSEYAGVWLFGDGSGHAFKHAPAIAARAANMIS